MPKTTRVRVDLSTIKDRNRLPISKHPPFPIPASRSWSIPNHPWIELNEDAGELVGEK